MSTISPDALGIVASFACDSAREARAFGAVCTRWQRAFRESTELWESLSARRWPGRRGGAIARSYDRFKAVVLAELRLRPLTHSELNPIENCDFVFRCPQYAEVLGESGEMDENGRPILHCNVCDRHVYMVTSQEERDSFRGLRRCVIFKRRRVLEPTDKLRPVVVVLLDGSADGAIGLTAMATLLHSALTDYPDQVTPSTIRDGHQLLLQNIGFATLDVRLVRFPGYDSNAALRALTGTAAVAVNLTPDLVKIRFDKDTATSSSSGSFLAVLKTGCMVAPPESDGLPLSGLLQWFRRLYSMDREESYEMGEDWPGDEE